MQFFPGISLAETITNSFQGTPESNVIFFIRPRGIWLRTAAPKSMSGRTISSTYCDLPVTLSRPSLRGTDLPMMRSLFISNFRCLKSLPLRKAGGEAKTCGWGIVYDRLGHNGVKVFSDTIKLYEVDRRILREYSRPPGSPGNFPSAKTGLPRK